MFQSSSTWAAAQAASTDSVPRASASAINAEPVSVVTECSAPSGHGSAWDGGAGGGERRRGLRDEHDALCQHEARAQNVAREGEHRVPGHGLPSDQPGGSAGAVAHEIAGEVALHVRRHRRGYAGNAVDDRVGEPRERHPGRIDEVALRLPFGRQRLRQRARGRRQHAPRGSPHRPAVEQDAELALPALDRGVLVEPPPQLRPHRALRRLGRIERLAGENLLEQIAHGV